MVSAFGVKTVKRTYTMVRIHRPNVPENPIITQIYDEDENEALEEFIRLCDEYKLPYTKDVLVPQ